MELAIGGIFGAFAATYLFLRFLLEFTQDAKEPPAILTGIPFLSPLISMIREKSNFHTHLRFVPPLTRVCIRLTFGVAS